MVYHHAQHQAEARMLSDYTNSGLVPCGSTPPFRCDSKSPCFDFFALANFSTFSTFSTSDQRPSFLPYGSSILHSATARREIHPILCTDTAIHKYLCDGCCLHRCRAIPTSGEETLAFPEFRTCTCSIHHLFCQPPVATTGYEASYWLKECAEACEMSCAMGFTHGR